MHDNNFHIKYLRLRYDAALLLEDGLVEAEVIRGIVLRRNYQISVEMQINRINKIAINVQCGLQRVLLKDK